jgi:pyruvate,orthophosphate dikinase
MAQHVYSFGDGQAEGDPSRKDLLGGKGAGLAEMTRIGLPVPPGFTLSTEVCAKYIAEGKLPAEVTSELDLALTKLEASLGMRFGDPAKPLLVSVRSGARASMPGMMDTILNLGLNDATAEGLAKLTGNARFAFDAYRRFVAMFADVALGIKREAFEHALDEARGRVAKAQGIDTTRLNAEELKRKVPDSQLPEEELRALVATFKGIVRERSGKEFPTDPKEQLLLAIGSVFGSWQNHRAIVYRKMHDIPDHWGTACNVQAMVFGNLGDDSATGVAFTRDPPPASPLLRRVAPQRAGRGRGRRHPHAAPAHEEATPRRATPSRSSCPRCTRELVAIAGAAREALPRHAGHRVHRPAGEALHAPVPHRKAHGRAMVRIAVEMAQRGAHLATRPCSGSTPEARRAPPPDARPEGRKEAARQGPPRVPGRARARSSSTPTRPRLAAKGEAVILVRLETSPEDIHGMKAARGILTARGGMTSHAAVVARGMGKCCVAGCADIDVRYDGRDRRRVPATGEVVLKQGRRHHARRRRGAR